ncbi:MAG: L-serine ammonia-lyase, partial [Pseudomonadales bacterium]|nr:L-serine ammonia-lyase [Pseudomonadales bacterium]
MSLSIFDLFKIGIGPSSSHTVGPVIAANRFIAALKQQGRFATTARVKANLYGSLAMTGKGHSTDIAVMLGLLGEKVDTVDPDQVEAYIAEIYREKKLNLNAEQLIQFDPEHELVMNFGESLEQHPNGMRLTAYDSAGIIILNEVYFSVGGGFVLSLDEICNTDADTNPLFVEPYPFNSAAELLQKANQAGLSIAELVLA